MTAPGHEGAVESWRWGWAAGLGAEARIGHGNWLARIG
jgi:hypothetical protein